MKVLSIQDIHEKTALAQAIIDHVDHDKLVLTGDYFDERGFPASTSSVTATWLKEKLHDPSVVALIGNHDSPYIFSNPQALCFTWNNGYSAERDRLINAVLTPEDKAKLRGSFFLDDRILFTHAGFSRSTWIELGEISMSDLEDHWKRDSVNIMTGRAGILHGVTHERGGHDRVPGITWCDLGEFVPIPGIVQIFGHTRQDPLHMALRITLRDDPRRAGTYRPENDSRSYERLLSRGIGIGTDSHLNGYVLIDTEEKTIEVFSFQLDESENVSGPIITGTNLVWKFDYVNSIELFKSKKTIYN